MTGIREAIDFIKMNPLDCIDTEAQVMWDEAIETITKEFEKLEMYEKLEKEGRLLILSCKVGDTVYRICPKCNDKHNGSCENCAWRNSLTLHGCQVFGMWSDGQYPPEKCTIVPMKVVWNSLPTVIENLGKRIFLTYEDAERKLNCPASHI